MGIKVAVAGASGYAGGEILRLIASHPEFISGELTVGALTASSSAGQRLGDIAPHLSVFAHHVLQDTTAQSLAGHDVVFLALPHGHSARIAKQLSTQTLVIDCAADFRLRNPAYWERYYGSEHAGTWPYGIPEMPGHREQIKGAKRIAIPGCFPTGATLALMPAVAEGLIQGDISITSITGVSGAGKTASTKLLGAETMGSLRAYNTAGKHRHNPEIVQNLQEVTNKTLGSISFTPVLAPLARGILSVATASLSRDIDKRAVRAAYQRWYDNEPFIQFLSDGMQPETQNVQGSNSCHVQAEVDTASGRLLVTSAIDNLTKGTAGAAVQCMNLALGLEETAGLPIIGVAP